MATTDFEGYTHEQLLGMIASLDPETVKARGTQLSEAAAAIKEIGESLKRHRVTGWEGEAAHAFQDWVSRAGSATLKLGAYGEAGGKWMTEAAQTMVEVKANTPKYDASAAENLEAARKHHHDPDAQQLARTAHTKLTTDHAQAVQQLTKLAQSYEASTAQMKKAEPPTFPPPPGVFAPRGIDTGETSRSRPSGGFDGVLGAAGASYVSLAPGGNAPFRESGWAPGPSLPPASSLPSTAGLTMTPPPAFPDRGVGVDLDHVAALPDRTMSPTLGLPAGPGPSGPGGNPLSGPVPPLALTPLGGPPTPAGGTQPVTRPPVGIGGKAGGMPGPPPRDSGIVGGRPISTGGPSVGIPRGTVIGGEAAQAGSRVMPGMMGGNFGGSRGAQGGSVAGRRMAMEPGGVVGGQPFTQGGSGIVRGSGNAVTAGAMGPAGAGANDPGRRRGERAGKRPGLSEDEETWQDDRRVVPPVVD